jgi:hypothetical protein
MSTTKFGTSGGRSTTLRKRRLPGSRAQSRRGFFHDESNGPGVERLLLSGAWEGRLGKAAAPLAAPPAARPVLGDLRGTALDGPGSGTRLPGLCDSTGWGRPREPVLPGLVAAPRRDRTCRTLPGAPGRGECGDRGGLSRSQDRGTSPAPAGAAPGIDGLDPRLASDPDVARSTAWLDAGGGVVFQLECLSGVPCGGHVGEWTVRAPLALDSDTRGRIPGGTGPGTSRCCTSRKHRRIGCQPHSSG